ncbi:ThiF family adenylyltransferase [Candidatus Woesearchaeota archaeon]|nr:ThiF family adenylyltransferase [Candidatus Woesearchaeota archaeon]
MVKARFSKKNIWIKTHQFYEKYGRKTIVIANENFAKYSQSSGYCQFALRSLLNKAIFSLELRKLLDKSFENAHEIGSNHNFAKFSNSFKNQGLYLATMDNTDYRERYSRQILYQGIGKKGQQTLQRATIAIIGLGALGSVTAELLVRAGIGKLVLIDRDCVELSNLQRQHLYKQEDIGKPKVIAAKDALFAINPSIAVTSNPVDLTSKNIEALLKSAKIIIDGTDNLATRYLINDYGRKYNKTWIYGGAIASIGTVMVIDNRNNNNDAKKSTPCFSCVFPDCQPEGTCDTIGVLNSITTIVGALEANECIKIVLGQEHEQQLIRIDLNNQPIGNNSNNRFQTLQVKQRKNCSTCLGHYEYLDGRKLTKNIRFCSSGQFQFYGKKQSLQQVKKRLEKLGKVIFLPGCLHFKQVTIFNDGRCLIKAKDLREAKNLYAKYIGD